MKKSNTRSSAETVALIADVLQVPVSFLLDDGDIESVIHGIEDQRAEVARLFDTLPDNESRLAFLTFTKTFTRLATYRANLLLSTE